MNGKKKNEILCKKEGEIGNLADGADDFEANGSGLQLRALCLLIPLCVPLLRFDLLFSTRHLPLPSVSLFFFCVLNAKTLKKFDDERRNTKTNGRDVSGSLSSMIICFYHLTILLFLFHKCYIVLKNIFLLLFKS